MDYYSTLGVNRNATDDEIKKAYRSMAMKHHPDRGGDEKKFKEIEEAYRTLSDPQKKQIVDMGGDPNGMQGHQHNWGGGSPFEFHFNSGNFGDMFGNFGFGQRHVQRNKTLNISIELTLEEVLTGKTLDADISLPAGRTKRISIEIPSGIDHGQQIRYQGMGDNSIPSVPPGDLIVNVGIRNNTEFRREGDSLILDRNISVWDAILGRKLDIKTLDGKNLELIVPAGTQAETILSCRNEGLPNMRTKVRGNLLIRIKIMIPRNLNNEQKNKIEQLKNEF
jgi:DnaJ-class molecular chaperone